MSIRRGWIFIFVAVFLVGFVSAAVKCIGDLTGDDASPDDIIVVLSALTNAHLETWYGAGGYNRAVCFSERFPLESAPAVPHPICTQSNTLLKLSSTTNSHGEDKNLGNYQVPVCYGNLNCSLISDGPLACKAAGEQTIFRLSDVTNAHAKGSSGPGGYNQILCCTNTGGGASGSDVEAWWLDSNDQVVSEVYTNATIHPKVYATVTNYDGNPDNTYDVYSFLNPGNDSIFNNKIGYQDANGHYRYNWTIFKQNFSALTSSFDQFRFDINGLTSKNDLKIMFCGDGETQVAWGEACDDAGYTGPGDTCRNDCTLAGSGTDAYWADMMGTEILDGTTVDRGDVVQLIFEGGGAGSLQFQIEEMDSFSDDGTGGDDPVVTKTGSDIGGDAVATWPIPLTGIIGAESETSYELEFEIDGTRSNGEIWVPNGGKNDDDTGGQIDKPLCGTDYRSDFPGGVGPKIDIEFSIIDLDSLISWTVKVNGNEVESQSGVLPGTYTVSYDLIPADNGTTEIEVEVSSSGGDKFTLPSNIIVIDKNDPDARYVAACIKTPKVLDNINTDYVHFNASTTRAIDYTSATDTVAEVSKDQLNFYWTFSDGRAHPDSDGANLISHDFWKYFNKFGNNWASLRVTA